MAAGIAPRYKTGPRLPPPLTIHTYSRKNPGNLFASTPGLAGLMPSVLGILSCIVALGRVRPSERDALWALYEAADGANWLHNENWDLAKDPCRKHSTRVPFRTFASEPFQQDATFEPTPWFGVGCIDPCDDYLDGENCTAGRIISLKLRSVQSPAPIALSLISAPTPARFASLDSRRTTSGEARVTGLASVRCPT